MGDIANLAGKALAACVLLAASAHAADILRYAEEDGTEETVAVVAVIKEDLEGVRARIQSGGRARRITVPARRILDFRRGDPEDVNQWAKNLARGKRLLAAGQIKTEANVPGAEELFVKVAYSTEKGTPGQEATEAVAPWHNKYATFYLIEARMALGDPESLQRALETVAEFEKRSSQREGSKVKMDVPADQGTTRTAEVYGWGESWLEPHVQLCKARILRKLGKAAEAKAAYQAVVDLVKKKGLSPVVLAQATIEQAEMDAEGKPTSDAENLLRSAGTRLLGEVTTQKDDFGRETLRRFANQALLRGADLLLKSAAEGKVTYKVPLDRYENLRDREGRNDEALAVGAQTGVGVCLVELGEGRAAYEALLDVVCRGYGYPEQMARALYYLGRAAPLYAEEVDRANGDGGFLREAGRRWWTDLKERFPGSPWAEKVENK